MVGRSRFGGTLFESTESKLISWNLPAICTEFRNHTSLGVCHSNGACKDDSEREREIEHGNHPICP